MVTKVELPGETVSGSWLAEHIDDVAVLDVRWYLDGRSGRAAYVAGHVPGAQFLDLDADLSAPPAPEAGRHPLPSASVVSDALGRLGVGDGDPVIVYDDASGSVAARAWWLLRALGQPVAVLDGGLAAWPGELTTEVPQPSEVTRRPAAWPAGRFLDADDVSPHLGRVGAVLLDARATARYEQGDAAIDPRPGHIPGARSAPWSGNIDPATGRFLPADQLAARFAALGVATTTPVAAYCGSGVTACHDLLALTIAGVTDTALYTGSWSQWGADESRPAEVGPDPTPTDPPNR
jgi:thiosulfate/3-mercaptopyruvate sulfurtransferase